MKKCISLITTIVFVVLSCISVYAQNNDDYDIQISIPNIIHYKESGNLIKFSVTFNEIERFERFQVFIDFDTNLLEFEYAQCADWIVVSEYGGATVTGVEFSARGTEWIEGDNSYSSTISGWVKVKGTGKHNINIRVEAKDKDGNPMDAKVKFTAPCDEIADISQLDYIKIEEKYLYNEKPKHAFFDIGTSVSEVIDLVDAENVAVKNAAGEIMAPEALIATGSRIVTLFKGYEVDFENVCIKYDVDCDGEITASDARKALRFSANLENLDDIQIYAANVNGDDSVTAGDSRIILRVSAGLE